MRAGALALGIAAATTAFIVLTGQVAEQRLVVRGKVQAANVGTGYDILVRPAGSRTELEKSQGLVRSNFLAGQFGGISMAQWHQIQRLPGIEIAAPIAMVGYVLQSVSIPIDITDQLSPADKQLFTASIRRRTDRGLSTFDQPAISYSFVSSGRVTFTGSPGTSRYGFLVAQRDGPPRLVCPIRPKATGGPFEVDSQRNGTCWSRANGPDGAGFTLLPRGRVGILVQWSFPFLLAAVDPAQEAALAGLDKAVSSGSYLPQSGPAPGRDRHSVPVLMADHAGLEDQDEITIRRLSAAAAARFGAGLSTARLDALLDTERGPVVSTKTITAEAAYQRLLTANLSGRSDPVVDSYWTSGLVSYRLGPDGSLQPRPVTNPADVWAAGLERRGYVAVAPDAADTAFRRLTQHPTQTVFESPEASAPRLTAVGTFDQSRLSGGSKDVLLGGYRTDLLEPADERSRKLLGGKPLMPDSNIAGYLLSAPTMLTSLDAASVFTDQAVFSDVSSAAPISAVKVRVAGARGSGPVSRERIRLAAEAIASTTGLDVDVTVGSSPTIRTLVLPAGSAGRPTLELSEPWQRKGVMVAILRAVDRKSMLLFTLVLVVCGLFIANAAAAAARSPSGELSTLSCLGWTRGQLVRLLLAEMALIGSSAGVAGVLVSLATERILGVAVGVGRALVAVPAALVVTLLAAALPVWRASRPGPLYALGSPNPEPMFGWAHGRGAARARGPWQLAYLNLRYDPGRTGLGMAAVGIGSAGLTLLLSISVAFRGSLVGSLLGDAVSLQARRVDYLAVAIILVLAAIAVADVSYLNMRERRNDLALLRAVGWTDGQLSRLITTEGAFIGLAGSVLGAGLGLAIAVVLEGSTPATLWLLAALAAGIGTLVSVLASLAAAQSLPRLVGTPSLAPD